MTLKEELEIPQRDSIQLNSSVTQTALEAPSNMKDGRENRYKMRVLHLIHDDKFFDSTINTFRYLGVNSTFVLLCKNITNLKYIQDVDAIQQIEIDSLHYDRLIQEIDMYDLVWVHYLDEIKANFVNKISKSTKVKVFWSAWGGDYVDLVELSKLRFRSRLAWLRSQSLRGCLYYFLRSCFSFIGIIISRKSPVIKNALMRIDYFSTVLPSEEILVRKLLSKHARYYFFAYTSLPTMVSTFVRCDTFSKSIWFGNSATYTNHHLDWLPTLARKTGWKIVMPLSYGDRHLTEKIKHKAKKKIGSRLHLLLDFMPYLDYLSEMQKCSVFVFDMFRQQAMGNIFIAVRMGGCVFLNEDGIVYKMFSDNNIKVYTMKDFKRRFEECLKDFAYHQEENIQRMNAMIDPLMVESQLRKTMLSLENKCVTP